MILKEYKNIEELSKPYGKLRLNTDVRHKSAVFSVQWACMIFLSR